MAINNNLFPGIVDTYMPAFLIDSGDASKDTCRVYFSLSKYNNLQDIANVQVTVTYQNNNKSALNKTKYPCEIMLTTIKVDNQRISNDRFYFEITKADMENNQFEINQFYKVQFRFTGQEAEAISLATPQAINVWLNVNLPYFSEWSRVCLVKGISTPKLTIKGLIDTDNLIIWTAATADIIGKLTFANPLEKEVLKSYRIKVIANHNKALLFDSGIQYTSLFQNVNEINYTLPLQFKEGEDYLMTIEYQTNNLYTDTIIYNFMIIQSGGEKLNATIAAVADKDNGRVKVHIQSKDQKENFYGNITIRRSSNQSNFTIWDDVCTLNIVERKPLNLDWYDYTIESGVLYKYCAQKRNSLGDRGIIIETEEPVLIELEDMFLTAAGKQLQIKFNPKVTSFKHQISESKTETIGSKYPFIKRNGMVDYKTFPITGMISFLEDENNIFTSKENVFKDYLNIYQEWNKKNRIDNYNDYIYEKRFRDLVIDFLYKDNVKLFRTATEGNILVKLMDINFTPESVLGGYIYSFNCTAYEIAECNQKNIDFYNIQPIGYYNSDIHFTDTYFGQVMATIKANENVLDNINEEYKKYAEPGFKTYVDYLDNLKLNIEQEPYLIGENENGPYKIEEGRTRMRARTDLNDAYLGYIAYINDKPIVISAEGIYELTHETVQIKSLSFPVDTKINLEYHLSLTQRENTDKTYKSVNYTTKIGQVWGSFNYQKSIFDVIKDKYFEKNDEYLQAVTAISQVSVEAEPGTVVYIKEAQDDKFNKHIIGETCLLDLNDEDTNIEGIYFSGIHFEEATAAEQERDVMPDNHFKVIPGDYYDFNSIKNPVRNGVYTIHNTDTVLETIEEHAEDHGVVIDQDLLLDTQATVANKEVGIHGKRNQQELTVNRKQIEMQLENKVNQDTFTISEINKEEGVISINAMPQNSSLLVDDKQIEENILTLRTDDYNLIMQQAGNDPHALMKVLQDRVAQDNSAIIKYKKTINDFYRIYAERLRDKEFALLMKELINATNQFIWYNNKWYVFTKEHDLLCPVEGIVNYYCEIMKGRFV